MSAKITDNGQGLCVREGISGRNFSRRTLARLTQNPSYMMCLLLTIKIQEYGIL